MNKKTIIFQGPDELGCVCQKGRKVSVQHGYEAWKIYR